MATPADARLRAALSGITPRPSAGSTSTHLHAQSAAWLVREIRQGRLLPSALLEALIGRVVALDGRTNAVVVRDFGRARARARGADRAAAAGEWWGPLHGLPLSVKDNLDVEGLPTSRGDPALARGPAAQASDDAVARLQAAGAIIFGKSNLPLQGSDIQSYNDAFGVTTNPHLPSRTPGGSSGGGAAAVAARLTPVECGTDIGGSLRFPSHCCGIYGHKPTWGLVPKRGGDGTPVTPTDLWVTGPLARSAEDLQLLLGVLAEPYRAELPAANRPSPMAGYTLPPSTLGPSLQGCRVAVWADDGLCPVGDRVAETMRLAVDALRAAGAVVDEQARPGFDAAHAHRTYLRLLGAATASRMKPDAFAQMLAEADETETGAASPTTGAAGLGIGDEEAFEVGAMTMRHHEWLAVDEERARLRLAWARFFEAHDILLMPVGPALAFAHDHSEADAPYWRASQGRRVALDRRRPLP